MAKLSNVDRAQIIQLYAQGNVTQAELAEKYHVTRSAIAKLLNEKESIQKVTEYKEKVYKSMQEFLESQQGTVQALIHDILESVQGDIKGAKLRDKMGALKILVEAFPTTPRAEDARTALDRVCEAIEGQAKKE